MEKNSNKVVIALLIVIIIILVTLCVLFATGTITFKSNMLNSDANNNNSQTSLETQKDTVNNISVLSELEAQNILKSIVPKCFEYVHSLSPFCGKRNTDDYLSDGEYIRWEASEFSSKDELTKYLKTFLSDEIINKYSRENVYVYDMYKEENGKLYCLNSNKDCGLFFDSSNTTYQVNNITENSISATGKIGYGTCGHDLVYFTTTIELLKNNNNEWIVSKYIESKD